MNWLDWIVLIGTLLSIVGYGIFKTRNAKDIKGFLLGNKELKWWTIGISIMATQASAITFLSTPGQAYADGMRFMQFYIGMPLAMVVLCVTAIPIFYKLNVFTAYEYLEGRFDLKTRSLAAFLFLFQRGLAAGITIYAPSIILSTLLGWPLFQTNLIIGVLVIFYTVSGGTKAVSQTQQHQMTIMMGGMILAGVLIVYLFPKDFTLSDGVALASGLDKMELISWKFDLSDRYNIWSGILGGFFLFLSYFGTDQSQVQRYLSGKSMTESRLGLLLNGILKIPMQLIILFIGVLVFVFFQFEKSPLFFNTSVVNLVYQTEGREDFQALEKEHEAVFETKKQVIASWANQDHSPELMTTINELNEKEQELRAQAVEVIKASVPEAETRDTDYVFITFVMRYLPHGIIGLLLAAIFSAAMSSTASELNALGSTTLVDIYKRNIKKDGDDEHYLKASRWFTFMWGVIALIFASYASMFENLIQAVNIIGSLFYGTILGIFLTAFYLKKVQGDAVFVAALIAEVCVVILYKFTNVGYLWFNLIGCALVICLSMIFQQFFKNKQEVTA
ncbi:sodium:solute symporter [Persicobacter sp. CCB-QB2]|uniref:sodium:solute symporter n=1 Tax=Persicobacter sp. CCB-QB2 TaxID=1561025 RepID=UPI0006A96514|nr:sodium:solute symporter [Persicobacter sp. CCB-QB2]